jgi:ABC-type branched-subunit amino acid transport system ATPase component
VTGHNWMEWFELSEADAARLVLVEQALREAGICSDAETVLEVGRFILNDRRAPQRLRKLADIWERIEAGSHVRMIASNGHRR